MKKLKKNINFLAVIKSHGRQKKVSLYLAKISTAKCGIAQV